MQSVPYLFADAVVGQLDSRVIESDRRPGRALRLPREFVKSVWQRAFATHRRERVDISVCFDCSDDGICFYAESLESMGVTPRVISVTELCERDWDFHRITTITFTSWPSFALDPSARKHISYEQLPEILCFVASHSSNWLLRESLIKIDSLSIRDKVMQMLDVSQFQCSSLCILDHNQGNIDYVLKLSENDALQHVLFHNVGAWDPKILPLLQRLQEYQRRPRSFLATQIILNARDEMETLIETVVRKWKVRPQNRVDLEMDIPTALLNYPEWKVDEFVSNIVNVEPTIRMYTVPSRGETINYDFTMRHETENEVLRINVDLEFKSSCRIHLTCKDGE